MKNKKVFTFNRVRYLAKIENDMCLLYELRFPKHIAGKPTQYIQERPKLIYLGKYKSIAEAEKEVKDGNVGIDKDR